MKTVIQVLIALVLVLLALTAVYTATNATIGSANETVSENEETFIDCLDEGVESENCRIFGDYMEDD